MKAKEGQRRSAANNPKAPASSARSSTVARISMERTAELLLPLVNEFVALSVLGGVGSGDFVRIAKQSFVLAASRTCRFRNGRINASKVAALTGLTRIEVRSLLTSERHDSKFPKQNRALRVAAGWMSDENFTDPAGKPRALALKGSGHTFEELVRKYSGDISAGPISSELQRLGIIRVRDGQIALLTGMPRRSARVRDSLLKVTALVAPTLAAAYASAIGTGTLGGRTIEIVAFDEIQADLVRKRAGEIVDATVSALKELQAVGAKKSFSQPRNRARHLVSISIALCTATTLTSS